MTACLCEPLSWKRPGSWRWSELPEVLVRRERLHAFPDRVADEILRSDQFLGLCEHRLDEVARDDHDAVGVTDDVVAGCHRDTFDLDRVAPLEDLPARNRVLWCAVAREHRQARLAHEVDAAAPAVDHDAHHAPGPQRGRRELTEVCACRVARLVDGDVTGRNRAEHLEDAANRHFDVDRVIRPPLDREGRPCDTRPARLERDDLRRKGLVAMTETVEHVGQRGGVDPAETGAKLVAACGHHTLPSCRQVASRAPIPQSTARVAPVIAEAWSLSRNTTALPTSRGSAIRPSGMLATRLSSAAAGSSWRSSHSCTRRVSVTPGATALTRTPAGAYSSASERVRPSSPAFAAA